MQPAIDYYYEKGTPDEKLRTYYYQGRIYQNKGDKDLSMKAFINARELKDEIIDTLTYAKSFTSVREDMYTFSFSGNYVVPFKHNNSLNIYALHHHEVTSSLYSGDYNSW